MSTETFVLSSKGPFNPERPSLGADSTLARAQVFGCVNTLEGTGRFWPVKDGQHGHSSVMNPLGQCLEMCVLVVAGSVLFLQSVMENQARDVSPMPESSPKKLCEKGVRFCSGLAFLLFDLAAADPFACVKGSGVSFPSESLRLDQALT